MKNRCAARFGDRRSGPRRSSSGQAVLEYTLLIVMVAGLLGLLFEGMPRVLALLQKPLTQDFARAYRYGDKRACGPDDNTAGCTGEPKFHPRIFKADNFRIFARGK